VDALVTTIDETKKDIEMTKDSVQKLKDQARESSTQTAADACPRTLTDAIARGCVEKQKQLISLGEPPEKIFAAQLTLFEKRQARQAGELATKRTEIGGGIESAHQSGSREEGR